MGVKQITRERAEQFVERVNHYLQNGYRHGRHPSALKQALKDMGVSGNSSGSWPARIKELYGLEPDWSLEHKESFSEPGSRQEDRESVRLKDEITYLTRRIKELQRELNDAEDLRTSVAGLTKSEIRPAKLNAATKKSDSDEVPVLFTSDFQWGEVVRPEEIDWLNAYNKEIAAERYANLIDRAIKICESHETHKYPGIIYLRGGDAISGEIHGELAETNSLSAIPAIQDLAEHEAAGIERLADHLGRVRVISVPGNHGRTTLRPRSKGYSDFNFETALAWYLESYFRNDKRVEFWTPKSGDAYFKVFGHRVLLTHGDRIGARGGTGFLGPVATITRGMKKTVDSYSRVGRLVDLMLVGHFHTPLMLDQGFSNGALAGYTEYARDIRATPHDPSQWLFFMSPRIRVTAAYQVYVDNVEPLTDSDAWFEVAVNDD